MKKLIIFSIVSLFLLITVLLVAEKNYFGPKLKELIEKKGSELSGGNVTVESVKVRLFPPAELQLSNLRVSLKKPSDIFLKFPNAKISLDLTHIFKKHVSIAALFTQPKLEFTVPKSEDNEVPQLKSLPSIPEVQFVGPLGEILQKFTVGFQFKITKGQLNLTQESNTVDLRSFELEVSAANLSSALSLNGSARAEAQIAGIRMATPLSFRGPLIYSNQSIKTNAVVLSLGGIDVQLNGVSQLNPLSHNWNAAVQVSDLGKLPIPPALLPFGKWTGGVNVQIHASQNPGESLRASGQVNLKGIRGDIQVQQDQIDAKGIMTANADVVFNYDRSLIFKKIVASGDLKDLNVKYSNLFQKPNGVPLNFKVNAAADERMMRISEGRGAFASLQASLSGDLASPMSNLPSRLKVNVSKSSLVGFEKFFPMLSGTPVRGTVEVKAELSGNFAKPESVSINLNPVLLKDVFARVAWNSLDKTTSLEGPVNVDAKAIVVAQGKNLRSADIKSTVDLSGLKIQKTGVFQKKASHALKLNVTAKQKGLTINMSKSNLLTPGGLVNFSGSVSEPQAPKLNMKIQTQNLALSPISEMLPMLSKWNLSGKASASLNISGQFDFVKGIEKSPLIVIGSASADLPTFAFKTEKTSLANGVTGGAASGTGKAVAAEPLMPSWPVMKNLSLQLVSSIGKLNFNDLIAQGVSFKGSVKQGVLVGNADVRSVFNGRVRTNNIQINLLQSAPSVHLEPKIENLNLTQALTWATPQWKDLASGNLSGQMVIDAAHPSKPDFINATKVIGNAKIQNGNLSTLRFEKLLSEKLSKIPKIGGGAIKTGGVNANIDTEFAFVKSQMTFKKLNVLTPEQNELQATGWVRVDQTMDISGTAYLANAPIQGSVKEANSDKKGRFMIPVHFQGNVFNPQLHLADATINQILSRTASYELGRAKQQVQTRVNAEVDKQKQNLQKQIQDEAQKKLKDLFK